MDIIKNIEKNAVEKVVFVLEKGGLVIMPTETLYGAFVDATNEKAIKKLNNYKARPFGKPYSVAVLDQKMAEKYVELNNSAKKLYKNFLPGPLTVISKGKHKVAPGVESEIGTLGIRIPNYQLILNVVKEFGKPITATSANASYKKRPYSPSDILQNLSFKQKKLIDLIVDAGELPHNEPSTVVDTTLDDPIILRQGEMKFQKKNEILSRSEEDTKNLAKELWQKYESHTGTRAIVFALEGEMGVGKTIFTKGLGKALGIKEEIVSPSYDLSHEYQILRQNSGQVSNIEYPLIHLDLWRMLKPTEELKNLRAQEQINDKSILAIEWADRAASEIRKYSEEAIIIWVKITFGKGENERVIRWEIIK